MSLLGSSRLCYLDSRTPQPGTNTQDAGTCSSMCMHCGLDWAYDAQLPAEVIGIKYLCRFADCGWTHTIATFLPSSSCAGPFAHECFRLASSFEDTCITEAMLIHHHSAPRDHLDHCSNLQSPRQKHLDHHSLLSKQHRATETILDLLADAVQGRHL